MTRTEALHKIKTHLVESDRASFAEAEAALSGKTPMWGCLLMLEALGLVKFDDDPPSQ